MTKIESYKDLLVWQRSIALVKETYLVGRQLPQNEQFGLISQMQRSAVSIPSNIAEGYGRRSTNEYLRFLAIAFGSAAELETQLIIIESQYSEVPTENAQQLLNEVQKMLNGLMSKLRTGSKT